MVEILAKDVEEDLIRQEKMEIIGPRHQMVLMDEQEKFEGMTTHDVRKHFRSWVVDELEEWLVDRPSQEEMDEVRTGMKSATRAYSTVDVNLGARYNICVYVDDSCLDSLDRKSYPGPMIKLVWKDWAPQQPMEEDEMDTEMPPDIDVGWTDLSVDEYNWMYGMLCDYNRRYDEYCIAGQRLGI